MSILEKCLEPYPCLGRLGDLTLVKLGELLMKKLLVKRLRLTVYKSSS